MEVVLNICNYCTYMHDNRTCKEVCVPNTCMKTQFLSFQVQHARNSILQIFTCNTVAYSHKDI